MSTKKIKLCGMKTIFKISTHRHNLRLCQKSILSNCDLILVSASTTKAVGF